MDNKDYGFQIRRAKQSDIPHIKAITEEAFQKYCELAHIPKTIDALRETYDSILNDIQTKIVLVAHIDNIPVGSVRVELIDENTAYLSRFGVRVDYQSNGVGKALMNIVDRIMKERHIKQIQLHTASKVTPLVRFYYGRGFYIDSTAKDRGYIRALLCKDYE